MDRPTIEVYEQEGAGYAVRRGVQRPERAEAFARRVTPGGRRLDLGCGPGHYLPLLGRPAVAADAAHAMVLAAHALAPEVPAVRADLTDLPFDRGAFAGVWASKAHQHLTAAELPLALGDVHRVLEVGGTLELTMFATRTGAPTSEEVTRADSGDDLPGRRFTWWDPDHLAAVVAAAGFGIDALALTDRTDDDHARIELTATARRALPDHVGAGMRLLCCGLNPSLHAADAGVGYVTGNNRFWPALAAAGLSTSDRDPRRLLRHDRIGMTDLVKRATPRADELRRDEYRAGAERLQALCEWLRPEALAVVGLAGWRAGVDRKAQVGWQPERLGPTPVYVLPSTSGLNAGTSLAQLVDHLRAAAAGPPPDGG
ncbi:methyltransferase domain-containing protein [Aquihabitans sp. McL0605]|uniref:methyltransferase domain-containing protein n=1 Tax=Aquihabitans sp. McL0605 TaxID=3415671 RepID=UPI003CF4B0E0